MGIESRGHPKTTVAGGNATESIQEAHRLLAEGADPNGPRGAGVSTLLHDAVRHDSPALAARLLAAGADWTAPDGDGKRPLSLDFTDVETLHRIRQEYQRLPRPPYDAASDGDPRVTSYVEQIERDGVLRLEGFVEPGRLAQMQEEFASFVRPLRIARLLWRKRFAHYDEEEHWRPKHRAYITNDALRHSETLVDLCSDPLLIETANRYLRSRAHIKRVLGMRYLPSRAIRSHQFGWHHDMEDRQLKIMILLTDVGENDQYMTYVRGSHGALHSYDHFLRNDLDFDYVSSYVGRIDIVKLTGRAGDLFFFDSNGMHRGNRSRGRVRDAFFIEFTADRNQGNLWGSEIPRERLSPELTQPGHPLAALLSVTPKWKRPRQQERKRPSWAESLEDPANWI